MVVKRRQDDTVGLRFPCRNTVKKWNPGSDTSGPPDEVLEVDTLDDCALPHEQATMWRRLGRRWQLMALTVAVGLSALLGGGHEAPLACGGLATIGASAIASRLIADSAYTAFDNANAYLGVGDSSTAFAVGQTDLQAATNKARIAMDATYPSRASNVITLRATAASGVANFAWLENGVFNHASATTIPSAMLTRKAVNLGTKVSGATWEFTKTVTITAA